MATNWDQASKEDRLRLFPEDHHEDETWPAIARQHGSTVRFEMGVVAGKALATTSPRYEWQSDLLSLLKEAQVPRANLIIDDSFFVALRMLAEPQRPIVATIGGQVRDFRTVEEKFSALVAEWLRLREL